MSRQTEPATNAVAITPHDSNPLPKPTRAIFIGGDGNLAVEMDEGGEVTFVGLTAGDMLPVRVKKVKANGTTATNILGLW